MADILFKCPKCERNLAVDESGQGAEINCPDCNVAVTVPAPIVRLSCPQCNVPLSAPESAVGLTFECPGCQTKLEIPGQESSTATQPENVEPQPKLQLRNAEPTQKCPACGHELPSGHVICTQCGLNFKTGSKLRTSGESTERGVGSGFPFFTVIKFALLIVVLVGAWFYWKRTEATGERKEVESAVTEAVSYSQSNPADSVGAMQRLTDAQRTASAKGYVDLQKRAGDEIARLQQNLPRPGSTMAIAFPETLQSLTERLEKEAAQLASDGKLKEAAELVKGYTGRFAHESRSFREKLAKSYEDRMLAARAEQELVSLASTSAEPRSKMFFVGNAYDFILYVRRNQNADLSVDPELLGQLAQIKIEIAATPVKTGIDLLTEQLKPRGFVIVDVVLTPQRKVPLLTHPATSTYFAALRQLKNRDMAGAYETLGKLQSDTTDFGEHSRQLRRALEVIDRRDIEIGRQESALKDVLEKYKVAKAAMKTGIVTAKTTTSQRNYDTAVTYAKSNYDRAVDEAEKCCVTLGQLIDRAGENNEEIGRRLYLAHQLGLQTEAQYLFEQVYASYARLDKMSGLLRLEGLKSCTFSLRDLPDEVNHFRKNLRSSVENAETFAASGVKELTKDGTDAARNFAWAYSADRSCPSARIGTAYCEMQRQIKSLNEMVQPVSKEDAEARAAAIRRELTQQDKIGMLEVISTMLDQPAPSVDAQRRTKVGTARGLAVSQGEGELFPLAVRFEHVQLATEKNANPTNDYWGRLAPKGFDVKDLKLPIAFGDYGRKDPWMRIAATQAYKWLKSTEKSHGVNQGMKVEFHELTSGKAGDSAGVTIALAGYSQLQSLPVRQDVAMTGSIRADGAIKAVGGVPQKVAGAHRAADIEIVLVPKENESELLFTPVEQLCRLAIVASDDVQTYMKYALEPKPGTSSPEAAALQSVIRKLRVAQIFIQLGKPAPAREILRDVVMKHREIYSARRLLELIETHVPADEKPDAVHAARQEAVDCLKKLVSPKEQKPAA